MILPQQDLGTYPYAQRLELQHLFWTNTARNCGCEQWTCPSPGQMTNRRVSSCIYLCCLGQAEEQSVGADLRTIFSPQSSFSNMWVPEINSLGMKKNSLPYWAISLTSKCKDLEASIHGISYNGKVKAIYFPNVYFPDKVLKNLKIHYLFIYLLTYLFILVFREKV